MAFRFLNPNRPPPLPPKDEQYIRPMSSYSRSHSHVNGKVESSSASMMSATTAMSTTKSSTKTISIGSLFGKYAKSSSDGVSPEGDEGISWPWGFQHHVHVDDGLVGLPSDWLNTVYTEKVVSQIQASRAEAQRDTPASSSTPNLVLPFAANSQQQSVSSTNLPLPLRSTSPFPSTQQFLQPTTPASATFPLTPRNIISSASSNIVGAVKSSAGKGMRIFRAKRNPDLSLGSAPPSSFDNSTNRKNVHSHLSDETFFPPEVVSPDRIISPTSITSPTNSVVPVWELYNTTNASRPALSESTPRPSTSSQLPSISRNSSLNRNVKASSPDPLPPSRSASLSKSSSSSLSRSKSQSSQSSLSQSEPLSSNFVSTSTSSTRRPGQGPSYSHSSNPSTSSLQSYPHRPPNLLTTSHSGSKTSLVSIPEASPGPGAVPPDIPAIPSIFRKKSFKWNVGPEWKSNGVNESLSLQHAITSTSNSHSRSQSHTPLTNVGPSATHSHSSSVPFLPSQSLDLIRGHKHAGSISSTSSSTNMTYSKRSSRSVSSARSDSSRSRSTSSNRRRPAKTNHHAKVTMDDVPVLSLSLPRLSLSLPFDEQFFVSTGMAGSVVSTGSTFAASSISGRSFGQDTFNSSSDQSQGQNRWGNLSSGNTTSGVVRALPSARGTTSGSSTSTSTSGPSVQLKPTPATVIFPSSSGPNPTITSTSTSNLPSTSTTSSSATSNSTFHPTISASSTSSKNTTPPPTSTTSKSTPSTTTSPPRRRPLPSSKPYPVYPLPSTPSGPSGISSSSGVGGITKITPTPLSRLPLPPLPNVAPLASGSASNATTAIVSNPSYSQNPTPASFLSPPPTGVFSPGTAGVISPSSVMSAQSPNSGQLWSEIEKMMDPGMLTAIPGLDLNTLPNAVRDVVRRAGEEGENEQREGEVKLVGDLVGSSPPGSADAANGVHGAKEHVRVKNGDVEDEDEDSESGEEEAYDGVIQSVVARTRTHPQSVATSALPSVIEPLRPVGRPRLVNVNANGNINGLTTLKELSVENKRGDVETGFNVELEKQKINSLSVQRDRDSNRSSTATIVPRSRGFGVNGHGSEGVQHVKSRRPPSMKLILSNDVSRGAVGTDSTSTSTQGGEDNATPFLSYYLDGTTTAIETDPPSPLPSPGSALGSPLQDGPIGEEDDFYEDYKGRANAINTNGTQPTLPRALPVVLPLAAPTIVLNDGLHTASNDGNTQMNPPVNGVQHPSITSPTLSGCPTPLPFHQRYRGWVSSLVAPLSGFIDEAVDPREHYLDLTEIAEGDSGSVYAAKVNRDNVRKLRLGEMVKMQDSEDLGLPAEEAEVTEKGNSNEEDKEFKTKLVAIKSIALVPSGTPKLLDLQRELVLMKGLWHSSVLSVDAVYVDLVEDSVWVRMELMERSLADVIVLVERGLVLQERTIARFASDVLLALEFLWRHNIAHRDVRSDNMLINSQGFLKLADFSNAVHVDPARPLHTEVVGVPYWQAPELLLPVLLSSSSLPNSVSPDTTSKRSVPPYDPLKIDVWSLGSTVWEMAETIPPFSDTNKFEQRWPPLSRPEIYSPGFHEFLKKCSESAKLRPSAAELLKMSFINNACGRPVIVQLLAQCGTIESSLR